MKLILAAFLLLTIPAAGLAQDKLYVVSRAALWGGAGADLGTTMMGLRPGSNLRESNVVLKNMDRGGVAGVVIGHTVITDLATAYLRRDGHPRLATILNFAIGGAHVWAAQWNARRPLPASLR